MVDTQQFQKNHLYKNKTDFKNAFLEESKTWLNTPFRHMGRTKRGVDCQGLIIAIFTNLNFYFPKKAHVLYSFNWQLGDPKKCALTLKEYCERVRDSERCMSDICAFKVQHTAENHVGIWLNKHEFIHSSIVVNRSVQISDIRQRFWQNNYLGTHRLKFMVEAFKTWAVAQ